MPPKKNRAVVESSSEEEEDMMGMMGGLEKYSNENFSRDFLAKLPEAVRLRALLLLKMEDEYQKEDTFAQKKLDLIRKYEELYVPLFARRCEIISGTGAAVSEEEIAKGIPEDHKDLVSIDVKKEESKTSVKGLPGFWLKVLKHHVIIDSMITPRDEEVLKHLINISAGAITSNAAEGTTESFAVAFQFQPNDYLVEETLVITVITKESDVKVIRSPVKWKAGKNVTVETQKKKKGKGKNATTTTIDVPCQSFFNIFNEVPEGEGEDEENETSIDDDQTASLLRVLYESIIPNAVRYYTGEAPDGSDDVDGGDEEDEEDYDDDDDEEDDEDDYPVAAPRGRGRGGPARGASKGQPQPECKQQ